MNNAKLASVSTYHAQVPAFKTRLQQLDEDFPRFYQQVSALADLSPLHRAECLTRWAGDDGGQSKQGGIEALN